MDLITDKVGKVVQEMSFDAWGQRRNSANWNALSLAELSNFDHSRTTRGYTGHEMLDEVGLIHMNGRIYDPRLGRFMQADPFIQATADTQMNNRYSYVRNNSLNATDPSGYFVL
ncbi:RHS repeat-associated core domain-containing protein [uncultured Microbulbifer sp.]|uniref:RHS repeat domain-containing protein n=1 Tax=uncultured Microbulbifer sp. TaxID=348147 RepID=UPI00261E20B3|nr:RHS repeat-associated core domain-containing protein [uncultured Microbulbifer sp.]